MELFGILLPKHFILGSSTTTCQSGAWKAQAGASSLHEPTIAEVEGKETLAFDKTYLYAPCPSKGLGCFYYRISGGILQTVRDGSTVGSVCALNAQMACYRGSAAGGYLHVTAIGVVHKFQDNPTGIWLDRVYSWQ